MTAAGGGPAIHGAHAAPAGDGNDAPITARSTASRLPTVLSLARVETYLLVRNLLVLAGLVAAGALVWVLFGSVQPLWWNAAWQIGFGQLVLGMAVLAAAQLAAGRARRDGMADLYASFPATAGTRTLAHLTSLAGAAPASLLLIAAATAVVRARGVIGTPSLTVLAGGVLLVIAAGAAGIAIGTRFPHPLAGVLGALVLLLSSGTSHAASGAGIWLLPWEGVQDQLGSLPGPLAGYPPAGAHVLELAGIAVLAGVVALTVTVSRARARGGLATAGIAAVAVVCLAGALQLRPIPAADLNHLVTEAANPASVQQCTTASRVRYCLYPGFGRDLSSVEAPVDEVLAHLPARPGQPLMLRQVLSENLDSTFTHGHPKGQVSHWAAQLRRAPGTAAQASVIYLPVGSWPAAGAQLVDARFDVALAAADWAVRLPPQATGSPNGNLFLPCVPLGQAREPIAIWLAILATRPPAGELADGLRGPRGPGGGIGFIGSEVRDTFVPTWAYPGSSASYVTPAGVPQTTAEGYLIAHAMTGLPEQKVAHVLKSAWATWLNWHTSDAQLAAALGIRIPSLPAPAGSPSDPQTSDGDRGAATGQRAAEPGVHGVNPPAIAPIRHAGRSRLSWLRTLPLIARPTAQTMPWVTLITGCLAGTAFLCVMARVVDTSHSPLGPGTVRLAFLPAVGALAFVLRTPFRPVTQATPVPAWLAPAGHLVLAAPVLAVTCWAQLRIMARTIPHALGHQPAISPVIAQLTGWCAVTVAVAACADRSRYADLGGAIAASVSFAAIALAWYAPATSRFLVQPPAAAHGVIIAWYAIATAASALTCAAMRDRWHRYPRSLQRLSCAGRRPP